MTINSQNQTSESTINRSCENGQRDVATDDYKKPLMALVNAVYDVNDLHHWEEGTAQYKQFIASIPPEKRWCFRNVNEGELQAIFLGEKPAMFSNNVPKVTEYLGEELQRSGLRCAGYYIYKPEAVERILREHPKEFEEFPIASAEEFMQALARVSMEQFETSRGLILGYPIASITAYEKQNKFQLHLVAKRLYDLLPDESADKDFLLNEFFGDRKDKAGIVLFFTEKLRERQAELGITESDIPQLLQELDYLLAAKHANVHGVIWVDFEKSFESDLKQQRLQAAFQRSGILDQN
ncbi:MAG: hypothetical protein KBA40_00295 [Candidatus Peribacteraceae bacterium]|nr:hypothetical protein [Candidatus Peribacteraceae bacterium]